MDIDTLPARRLADPQPAGAACQRPEGVAALLHRHLSGLVRRPSRVRILFLLAFLPAWLARVAGAWEATPALDFGLGGHSGGHLSGHAVVGINEETVFFAAKWRGSTEFNLFSDVLPEETLMDAGMLGGLYWNHTFGYFSVASGASWLRFKDRTGLPRDNPACNGLFCADSLYDTRVKYTVGLPLEALAVFKLWFIGVGMRVYANTNPHRSYVGSSLVLFLGGGATQRRHPADDENR